MKYLAAVLFLAVLLLLTGQGQSHKLPRKFVKGANCLYRYERGADGWATNTGNGYYGGLQMDRGFQGTYGTWLYRHVGTADRWTRHQQLTIAFRAYSGWKGYAGRGWSPWPNTARYCGLL